MRTDFCEMHKNETSKRRAKRVQDGATSRAGLTMPRVLFTHASTTGRAGLTIPRALFIHGDTTGRAGLTMPRALFIHGSTTNRAVLPMPRVPSIWQRDGPRNSSPSRSAEPGLQQRLQAALARPKASPTAPVRSAFWASHRLRWGISSPKPLAWGCYPQTPSSLRACFKKLLAIPAADIHAHMRAVEVNLARRRIGRIDRRAQ